VTAAALSAQGRTESGMRPVNPRRDMEGIAVLLEAAFAGELDPYGRHMVREMRAFGRAGWLGWLIGRLFLPPAAYPQGFVWFEEGRLVGNASLLPVTGFASRWVMANIAVDADHRRSGIARRLVEASLDHARQRGATEVLLQVRHDNQPALALYDGMGFKSLTTRTTWLRPAGEWKSQGPVSNSVRRRYRGEWSQQWDLARTVYPEGLIWPFPPYSALFRPRLLEGLANVDGRMHWVWVEEDQLLASISTYLDMSRAGLRLVMMVTPPKRGSIEGQLLAAAMQGANAERVAMSLDYEMGIADESLSAMGFRSEHSLTWMRIRFD
jgi:ribosomal protein S18 acetylase RimI-like enzyme